MDGLLCTSSHFSINLISFNWEIRAKQHPIKSIFFGRDLKNFILVFQMVLVLIILFYYFFSMAISQRTPAECTHRVQITMTDHTRSSFTSVLLPPQFSCRRLEGFLQAFCEDPVIIHNESEVYTRAAWIGYKIMSLSYCQLWVWK